MSHALTANAIASIAELTQDSMATVARGGGLPVGIVDHDQPAFYCVPAKSWEAIMDTLEDVELNAIADARRGQPTIEVSLDDL